MNDVTLPYDDRVFRITPTMRLLAEIEDEIGALPVLAARFSTGTWRLADLVAVVQMMLQAAGRNVDYFILGDRILQDGVSAYLASARRLLAVIEPQEDTP